MPDYLDSMYIPTSGPITPGGPGSAIGFGTPGFGQGGGLGINWGTSARPTDALGQTFSGPNLRDPLAPEPSSGGWFSNLFGGGSGNGNGGAGGDATGLGWNLGTARLVGGGLQTLGNLYSAWQANKLAKEQFALTKDIANTNLNSSLKAYNTQLSDRARARGVTEGQSPDQVASYIAENRLSRG